MSAPGYGMRGGGRQHGGGATLKDLRNSKTVLRLFRYIFRHYKVHIGFALLCIVVSSITSLASSLFTRTLIDDYIAPMPADDHPLAVALVKLGAILLAGIVAGYAQNLIMIAVGQGTMLGLRKDLFRGMQKLPLSYFDSHSHGDVMSSATACPTCSSPSSPSSRPSSA